MCLASFFFFLPLTLPYVFALTATRTLTEPITPDTAPTALAQGLGALGRPAAEDKLVQDTANISAPEPFTLPAFDVALYTEAEKRKMIDAAMEAIKKMGADTAVQGTAKPTAAEEEEAQTLAGGAQNVSPDLFKKIELQLKAQTRAASQMQQLLTGIQNEM